MNAFLEVFRFECRFQRRSPLFIVCAAVFFLITFLATASPAVQIGGSGTNLDINASFSIIQTQLVMSVIGMFAAVAFVAGAITRDYEAKTAEILFASGVPEPSHLLGRFAGGLLFVILVGVAGMLGTMFGTFMPWLDPERIGAFTFAPYWFSIWAIIVPNAFIVCALFFSAAALGRSMSLAYACAMVFIVAWITLALFLDPDDVGWAALVDPFGAMAVGEDTRYWTVFERNTALPGGSLVVNRLIWAGAGLMALLLTLWRYRFEVRAGAFRLRFWRRKARKTVPAPALREIHAEGSFGLADTFAQFRSQLRMDVRGVVRSMPFYVILALGTVNVFGNLYGSINQLFGTPIYPRTGLMLNAIFGGFFLFVFMIMIYYSGELMHRERQAKIAEILDASPYPNGIMVLSKLVALWFVVAMLLAVVMVTSIITQAANGYTEFELGLYLKGLFGIGGAQMYMYCVLAVFVQALSPNKWLGMLATIGIFLFLSTISAWDFEHMLYGLSVFAGPYSDMNGYGHFLAPFFSLAAYWGAFCVLLVVAGHLMFRRGYNERLRGRLTEAKSRATAGVTSVAALAALAFVALGGWIYYNTNVLNEYFTSDDLEQISADYEKAYSQYERMPQPDAINVDARVDIFPDERRIESSGTATLVNATSDPIEEMIVSIGRQIAINALEIDGATVVEEDPDQGFYRYRLTRPLAPGQQTSARWDLSWINDGFPNRRPNNRVVENGTFVGNFEIMPALGYDANRELGDNNTRRKYDLPPVERLPKLGDPEYAGIGMLGARRRTSFRVVVGTAEDQIAVAPGYLQRDWVENGRRYFEYEMDDPIWPFFSFSSARYEVARDEWNGVAIEIYYDAKHPYNVDTMIESAKASLEYYSREFSPYQYRQFRVLEFPRYASFAQSFPNTIPYSESIGFIADLRDEKDIDYVFYVTAHEMAHQWWAHQVLSSRMQGMTVPIETLAQYSALMVMEKEYGPQMMRRFLRRELDGYLRQRGGEQIEELPLLLVENQAYIHYQKGSVVMYALKDLIGEENVNRALRSFIDKFAFKEGRFATSRDLIDEFRAVAGPEHQALITDWFEKITLYDLAVEEASSEPIDGGYEVTLTVSARQLEAMGEGDESEVPLSASLELDIGVFPQAGAELGDNDLPPPLYLEKHQITSTTQTITVQVREEPARVGIDPYSKMIDRNPDDNLRTL